MSAIKAEHVGRRLARGRQLPAVLVRELEGRAGIGPRARYIPLAGHRNRFREVQCYRPAGQWSGTGIGNRHVHLEGRARYIERCGRTGMGRVGLTQGRH